MVTEIPHDVRDITPILKSSTESLRNKILEKHPVDNYPQIEKTGELTGTGIARSYTMQGILKYHGMADWNFRTAYFSSVSINNDAGSTDTKVSFDPALKKDQLSIGGKPAEGRERERICQTIDFIRNLAGAKTPVSVESFNHVRATTSGKGLGTSASASTALAHAAITAAFGETFAANTRFLTTVSRLLAGSGCRSAAGGMAIWFSYPGIPHEDSYAIRLDAPHQLDDISLITVPVNSRIGLKTERAHREAPNSPFFKTWLLNRKQEISKLLSGLETNNWQIWASLAEFDTILLHGVTMSGSRGNKLIAWEPESISLLRSVNEMRNNDLPVYFSLDTGPTSVFITEKKYENEVAKILQELGGETIIGSVAGGAHALKEKDFNRQN